MTMRGGMLVLAVVAWGYAFAAAAPAGWEPRDPVVADVVRMSNGGVSEAAIVEWLRKTRPRVAPLSADDLIGLSQAKVPQPVISELIGLATAAAPAPASPPPPSLSPPPPDPTPPVDTKAEVPVRWTISYRAASEADLDELPPDLALYAEGRLLARIPGSKADDRRGTIAFSRAVPPGTITLRALLERHDERDGAWRWQTRVVAEPITLEIPPGPKIHVTIDYLEDWLGLPRPPLSWSVTRDDDVLVARERQGGDPRRWPWLCEDIEAGMRRPKPDSVERSRLKDCVRWSSIWNGAHEVPARDAVRQEAVAQGFSAYPPTP